MIVSANTNEKKPKKATTKKQVSVEEKPAQAATAIRAKSGPKSASAKSGNETPSSKTNRMPSHEEVSSLAYRFFEQRGRQHGCHEQDWFRAEQELAEIS
jgi:hypothetical protein